MSFILGDQRLLKLFGLALLDRYAWALPGWLDRRLPRIAIEAPTPATEPV